MYLCHINVNLGHGAYGTWPSVSVHIYIYSNIECMSIIIGFT